MGLVEKAGVPDRHATKRWCIDVLVHPVNETRKLGEYHGSDYHHQLLTLFARASQPCRLPSPTNLEQQGEHMLN